MAEALYVVEGDFINEGKQYLPGTSLHVKAGNSSVRQSETALPPQANFPK
jgi:hypothetical protein